MGIKDTSCRQALNLSHQHNCHAPPPGFPGISVDKESSYTAGDPGSIPGWEDPLKKEMATHSSILAWEVPWREEPGGLRSVRVSKSQTQLRG